MGGKIETCGAEIYSTNLLRDEVPRNTTPTFVSEFRLVLKFSIVFHRKVHENWAKMNDKIEATCSNIGSHSDLQLQGSFQLETNGLLTENVL